jgi:Protein of unknown function (DUF2778)
MSVGTARLRYSAAYDHCPLPDVRPQRILAGAALGCVMLACGWTLCASLFGDESQQGVFDSIADQNDSIAPRGDKLSVAGQDSPAEASLDVALLDPRFISSSAASTFGNSLPLQGIGRFVAPALPVIADARPQNQTQAQPHVQTIATAPVPAPPQLAALRDRIRGVVAAANAQNDKPTLFERLFGKPQAPAALAYAEADTGSLGVTRNSSTGLYDRSTAVYDITARTVYLPDGTRLEAHSGLGGLLDDPRHADVHNRGVTPPTVYDLQERETVFHGVRALRLIPEEEDKVYGRSGLLAHSFMLGPNGDSNGCVSFRNYDAFLKAYLEHKITRLAVVTHLD